MSIIGAALGAIGGIAGGLLGAKGSKDAASTVASASDRAADVQWDMYGQSREDMAPWRQTGEKALNTLSRLVEAGPGEFQESPGYQFARSEGLDAINQSLANMGLARSGAHAKAAGEYATNLADAEYENFLRRFYQSLTPYQSLAGVGQTAAGQMGANALGTGQLVGQSIADAGAYRAGGQLGASNTLANLVSWGGQQVGDYVTQNALRNQMQAPQAGTYYDMPSGGGTPWYGYY